MMTFILAPNTAPYRRAPPVCHRTRPSRGRAERRSALYAAMSAYAAHFFPALDAELSAEQSTAVQPRIRDSTLNQEERLYSSLVYSLRPPQRFRKAELVAVSDGRITALATALTDARLAAPVGSLAAQTLSELAISSARVSVVPAVNSIPHERAIVALEAITKPQSSAGEITRLIVASLMDTPDINTRDLQQFQIKEGGQWFDLARETVVSVRQEELNRVVKKLPLNSSQRRAVRRALRARLTLIQGPPGTGKTLTAAHLIAACISLRTGPVLACTSSNVAADNLLRRVRNAAPDANIIRLGRISAVAEDQWRVCLDCLLECNSKVKRARNALQRGEIHSAQLIELEQQVATAILRKTDIVVATSVACGRQELKGLDFPVVVVDEATQATEPNVLIALMATEKMVRQVVLVGDHHQLPPTVLSRGLGERLRVSLFLRLWSCRVGCELLQVQYRMHPQIAKFPAKHFYFGALRNGVSEEHRILPRSYAILRPLASSSARTLFFDVSLGKEESESSAADAAHQAVSFFNQKEKEAVVGIVFSLYGPCKQNKHNLIRERLDVGIIAPYAAQVRLLEHAINKIDNAIEVSTVDAYQGREKDIIVLSTVRSNPRSRMGFLQDWRRLNVAITRARYLLVVVGNRSTLMASPHWAAWFAYAEEVSQWGV